MSSFRQGRADFDRVARAYRWLEYLALGPVLERVRMHHLRTLAALPRRAQHALILGDGDGRFTARLLAAEPRLQAEVVDSSRAMLALLHTRCTKQAAEQRLHLHHADALEFVAASARTQSFDLIVTHFFLDCLAQAELEQLMDDLVPALTPGALWLLSEFRIPGGLLHWPARLYVRSLYLAFRVLTGLRVQHLPNYAGPLRRMGFRLIGSHRALFGLLTTELWQLAPEPPRTK